MEKFFGFDFGEENSNVILLSFLLGKNSIKSINFFRKFSLFFETFDLERKKGIRIFDSGNFRPKNASEIAKKVKEVLEKKKFPVIISKSHLISLFSLQAFEKDIKIIVLDAHADAKNFYSDEKVKDSTWPLRLENNYYNCSTWLRRAVENGYKNFFILGLRACSEDELNFLEDNRILYFTSTYIKKNLEDVKKKVRKFSRNSKIYLSLDIDFFDPSFAPAVENPEPNGLSYLEFREIIDGIKISCADLVEFSLAPKKLMEITYSLALKSLFDLVLKFNYDI